MNLSGEKKRKKINGEIDIYEPYDKWCGATEKEKMKKL